MPLTGRDPTLNWSSSDERLFRADHAELVALRVGQYNPGLCASLPDVDPAGSESQEALDLLVAILGAGGHVEVHAVLDGLWIGDRHKAHSDGRILVGTDDDLAFTLGRDLPAERLGPEPGQRRQVVGVNDDVVKSDRHADKYARCVRLHSWSDRALLPRSARGAAPGHPGTDGIMEAMNDSASRRFPVTVTRLPVTRCLICQRTVAYRPGTLSEALTEHYRRAHPETLALPPR